MNCFSCAAASGPTLPVLPQSFLLPHFRDVWPFLSGSLSRRGGPSLVPLLLSSPKDIALNAETALWVRVAEEGEILSLESPVSPLLSSITSNVARLLPRVNGDRTANSWLDAMRVSPAVCINVCSQDDVVGPLVDMVCSSPDTTLQVSPRVSARAPTHTYLLHSFRSDHTSERIALCAHTLARISQVMDRLGRLSLKIPLLESFVDDSVTSPELTQAQKIKFLR